MAACLEGTSVWGLIRVCLYSSCVDDWLAALSQLHLWTTLGALTWLHMTRRHSTRLRSEDLGQCFRILHFHGRRLRHMRWRRGRLRTRTCLHRLAFLVNVWLHLPDLTDANFLNTASIEPLLSLSRGLVTDLIDVNLLCSKHALLHIRMRARCRISHGKRLPTVVGLR